MMQYFGAFGPQVERLRTECGMPSAIAGILKAPLDILADKLRGYIGLTLDMESQPRKVLQACEALVPHLYQVAAATVDPAKQVPIGYWMHRGCVPFVRPDQFESHYWPTIKPIIEELWKNGHQTLFYAEGDWTAHLDRFTELPERSIVYHVDRGDLAAAHRKLGHKFCLSGGIPNFLLSYRSADEVRAYARKVIDAVARDGGYIMDAGAIMQNDTRPENLRALTEFTREYGIYSDGHNRAPESTPAEGASVAGCVGLSAGAAPAVAPGVCIPWTRKRQELPPHIENEQLVRDIWTQVDALGSVFVWQCLLSF
jgi:uroporphyrinogen-III decarboxylase